MADELKNIICDIDGVLMRDNSAIEGAGEFIARVVQQGNKLIVLTNNPSQTPQDLQNRLASDGVDVPLECFYTSAMATADFLKIQEGSKAYVVGEGALTHELYNAGFAVTDVNPDFVVVGETRSFNWDMIQKAARFVSGGARFIATNPDVAGPEQSPACGALCAPIERISGKKPLFLGKPSAWMMRAAMNHMEGHSGSTVLIGDNLQTDILAGIQSGIETILVLSGVSQQSDLEVVSWRPSHIFENVGQIDVV